MDKKIILKKPNQTITVTNGEITTIQRKAYNVLLYKALQDLRIDNRQTIFLVSATEIKEMAGVKATDNWHLKKDLKALMDVKVECVHEKNNSWAAFVLLSYFDKEGDLLKFEVPTIVRESLLKGDYFTTLDLMVLKTLEGKYGVIFYELALRYNKVEIPKFNIDKFKKMTGTENYYNFNNLEKKVINPGIEEVNLKTDIIMDYEIFKTGRKVTAIKFFVKQKPQIVVGIPKDQKEQSKLQPSTEVPKADQITIQSLISILPPDHREKKTIQSLIDKYFKQYGFEYVKRNIFYANQNSKKNYRAYLDETLKNDYGLGLQEDQEGVKKLQEQEREEERKKELEAEKEKKLKPLRDKILQDESELKEFLASLNHFSLKRYNKESTKSPEQRITESPLLKAELDKFLKEKHKDVNID